MMGTNAGGMHGLARGGGRGAAAADVRLGSFNAPKPSSISGAASAVLSGSCVRDRDGLRERLGGLLALPHNDSGVKACASGNPLQAARTLSQTCVHRRHF
jgi:hypothetical protein